MPEFEAKYKEPQPPRVLIVTFTAQEVTDTLLTYDYGTILPGSHAFAATLDAMRRLRKEGQV